MVRGAVVGRTVVRGTVVRRAVVRRAVVRGMVVEGKAGLDLQEIALKLEGIAGDVELHQRALAELQRDQSQHLGHGHVVLEPRVANPGHPLVGIVVAVVVVDVLLPGLSGETHAAPPPVSDSRYRWVAS